MNKFYGDISKILCRYLLEATPYRTDSKVNFDQKLSEDDFFTCLFKEALVGINYKENELFNRKVEYAIKDVENRYAKVEMIHIAGYGGCGKTTFVRHLLWKMKRDRGFTYDVIDYEGVATATEPLLARISKRLKKFNSEVFTQFLCSVANEEIINMNRFHNCTEPIHELAVRLRVENEVDDFALKKYLHSQINLFPKEEEFLGYLLTLDFVMLLYGKIKNEDNHPIVMLVDNVDSLSNLHEESMLLTAMMEFITNCNFFFGQNLSNETFFQGKSISRLIENTKLIFFLTTRIATIRRYEELYPDLENLYGWNSIVMPEHYYDHKGIIDRRIECYLELEKGIYSETIKELARIKELADVAYSNYNFKRLFNGNIRFCIERLCDMVEHYDSTGMVQQCLGLYKMRNRVPEAVSGANGMFLAMILTEFKNGGVYRDKLQLSECKRDDEVTLSRLILTILREKGNRCSMLDLYVLLSPFFSIDEITKVTWILNEKCRDIWRRLVLFNVKFPTSYIELNKQGSAYKANNNEIMDYSEVELCTSGKAYVEFVVPHFEFMLSRHNHDVELLGANRLQPLFADSSEEKINFGNFMFRFEKKIDWVYQDVRDCCYNSVHFSDKICAYYGISREDYINNTVYNYMAHAQDGTVRFKQSYESRLIFSHIGYIERYRRYLLKKHKSDNVSYLTFVNERIVIYIKKFLMLYADETTCYQTEAQNRAARELEEAIEKIEISNYRDFATKIETGDAET